MVTATMIHPDLEGLACPVALLDTLPGNPRHGDVDAVAASYGRFGQRKPIVARRGADGRGTVIAGNHQLLAARRLGWEHIAVVWTEDDDIQASAFALADNRTGDLASYDDALLLTMLEDVWAADADLLADAGYLEEDLALLRKTVEGDPPVALTDPDDAPDVPAEPVTSLGDSWLLGEHRLLCADATELGNVEEVMAGVQADLVWTDPPYGVDYVGKTKDSLVLLNDQATGLRLFLAAAFEVAKSVGVPGASFYIAGPAGRMGTEFRLALADADWELHQTLVWVKDQFVLGYSDYHYRHEDVLYGWLPGPGRSGRGDHAGSRWYGDNAQSSVFEVPRPQRSRAHPTMKPVDLIVPCLRNSTQRGDVVLDPFAGSGSTLIACHGTGRLARLLELDPLYADVICRRWQEHTGIPPVLEATGEPHDFVGTS
jgi:DNA modification methylase